MEKSELDKCYRKSAPYSMVSRTRRSYPRRVFTNKEVSSAFFRHRSKLQTFKGQSESERVSVPKLFGSTNWIMVQLSANPSFGNKIKLALLTRKIKHAMN